MITSDMDDCIGSPCANGGSCVDHVGRYECICPRLYAGERCQISTGEPYFLSRMRSLNSWI